MKSFTKLVESMLTTPAMSTWDAPSAPAAPARPAVEVGPVSVWSW